MKHLITLYLTLLFVGCSNIKETTSTTTEPLTLPPVVIHDTVTVAIPYLVEVQNGIDIDSAKRDYFVKNCKGTMEIDKDGLRATISFLSRDNKGKAETITQLTAEVEKKKQELQVKTTTKTTESTPSNLWIFWNSFQYWISTFILGIIVGVVGLYILRLKTQLLNKFIP